MQTGAAVLKKNAVTPVAIAKRPSSTSLLVGTFDVFGTCTGGHTRRASVAEFRSAICGHGSDRTSRPLFGEFERGRSGRSGPRRSFCRTRSSQTRSLARLRARRAVAAVPRQRVELRHAAGKIPDGAVERQPSPPITGASQPGTDNWVRVPV